MMSLYRKALDPVLTGKEEKEDTEEETDGEEDGSLQVHYYEMQTGNSQNAAVIMHHIQSTDYMSKPLIEGMTPGIPAHVSTILKKLAFSSDLIHFRSSRPLKNLKAILQHHSDINKLHLGTLIYTLRELKSGVDVNVEAMNKFKKLATKGKVVVRPSGADKPIVKKKKGECRDPRVCT